MSLARKLALISGSVWLVICIAFGSLIGSIGVEGFAAPEGRQTRAMVAMVILPGYIINFAILWWSRRGRLAGDIDERDKAIERRATEGSMVIVLLTIFLVSIGLYEANVDRGSVPVGWLYIIAYGTIAWVSLLHPVLTLIVDCSGTVDG